MGKWFLTDYSATVGRILMIFSADPHENSILMKWWKNQPSILANSDPVKRGFINLRYQWGKTPLTPVQFQLVKCCKGVFLLTAFALALTDISIVIEEIIFSYHGIREAYDRLIQVYFLTRKRNSWIGYVLWISLLNVENENFLWPSMENSKKKLEK